MHTPWGASQQVTKIGAGIVFVSTASHGGFYVPPALNEAVPLAWRNASFNRRALQGWYEEDCDANMVPLCFPQLFTPADVARCQRMFDGWLAPKLAKGVAA